MASKWLAVVLLLQAVATRSALYFPQSDLSLRIPYISRNGIGLASDLQLMTVRTLRNDSKIPQEPVYKILSKDKLANFDKKNENIILQALPKGGGSSSILVQAKEKTGTEAFLEIRIVPQVVKGGKINCTNYLQDVCFWDKSKYKIYENQPVTLLGTLGPEIYKSICPQYLITNYELLNGTEFFHLSSDYKLYSNDSLDRDVLGPPKGTGPIVNVNVRCVIWEETTGIQYTIERVLRVDILDQNDNPPKSQTNASIEIHLQDFTQGDRLDENDLLFRDADSSNTNSYAVKVLEDVHNIVNLTYDTISIDRPNFVPSTAIYARLYSRSTLLPQSPYRVILQVRDESLLPGFGNDTMNVTLTFIGPRHHPTTTIASILVKRRIVYPDTVQILRSSGQYYRIAQPMERVNSKVVFKLRGPEAFNITRSGGIVFVAKPTALPLISPNVSLRIEWHTPDEEQAFSAILNLKMIEPTDTCKRSQTHSCANAKTIDECEERCGIGTGSPNETNAGGCVWRLNKANTSSMTEKYETCSPNLTFCPNYICDELEQLDPRICPQDCAVESDMHFAEANKGGRGIRSGNSVCWCDDYMVCMCGASFAKPKKGRLPHALDMEARKASSPTCGPSCLIGIVSASIFVLLIIVGSFVIWRFRMVKKVPRRSHRGSDVTNGLGILPLDYVDRGDGLLIGLESLTAVNRTLLSPKTSAPDPKWEYPRSKLTIEQVLGEGEFGRVLRARARDIAGRLGVSTVAVKTLKEDASASELADLLSEYQLLKEAYHPNVIRLLGACTSPGGPVYLIIEFAEFGSLRNYLRRSRHLESDGRLPCSALLLSTSPINSKEQDCFSPNVNYTITPRDILSFAWQICKGMAYLADIKLVHRDLAARNVLLAAGKVCKISDFGLTRDVYEDDSYLQRSKGRVPVKWMAPESLADHVYTSKSDVWSFGVLLWELVTLGASPYPGVNVHNLYNLLKAGYRMEKPANCSHQLYKLMVSCWHEEAGMRPSFKELMFQWERMLEDGVEYLNLNPRTIHNQAYFTSLHSLDSPSSSGESRTNVVSYSLATPKEQQQYSSAVNYLSKPSLEPVSKSDAVDKLGSLWRQPVLNVPGPEVSAYVNESAACDGQYESPRKLRHSSAASSSDNELASTRPCRPQSYIDMQAGLVYNQTSHQPQQMLLSFTSRPGDEGDSGV